MRANTAGMGWEAASRRAAARPVRAAAWIIAAWALVGSIGVAAADEPLRWKFKDGETLRFSVEQKMMMDTRGMGITHKSNRSQTIDFSWTVLSTGTGGEAEIRHRVERVRLRVESPPYMPFDFDSAATKDPQPGFEAESRQLKAQVGVEFIFKMKPTGEIADIKVPEETLKRLRDSAPAGAPGADISEKSIKETLLQASPPSFPENALAPGQSWKSRPAREPLPPFAMLLVDRNFTYQGPDPKSPNLVLVGIDTTVKIEPVEGADVKATIRKQEGKGSMTIDARAGHVVNTRQTLRLEIAVAAMGQSIEQTSETSSTMTLLP